MSTTWQVVALEVWNYFSDYNARADKTISKIPAALSTKQMARKLTLYVIRPRDIEYSSATDW